MLVITCQKKELLFPTGESVAFLINENLLSFYLAA
jgi:hypothetical protein